MRSLIYKKTFKKQFKLMQSRGKELAKLKTVIEILANDLPIPINYKDHALTGNFASFPDIHIEPDWILIYQKREATSEYPAGILSLELTGTHSDLF
ncbi:MAG: type II toxin-antitoxin system YafQ family toxin [Methylococcales bacterium]|nr:type II toxin-antitoxin system YafQ family toxin [Methylococcales bacterium]